VTFHLSQRSSLNLTGVHPDLVKVVMRALEISPLDFTVLEGLRTVKRQQELFASGASKTMKSRHIHGFAVDVAPLVAGSIRWDWPLYDRLIAAFKQAAKDVKVKVEFGYDWKSFKDAPHLQLPHATYPDPVKDA
jgi:peptidoglycan L-alanyl-D-glutamate endopeptidase CwlK